MAMGMDMIDRNVTLLQCQSQQDLLLRINSEIKNGSNVHPELQFDT